MAEAGIQPEASAHVATVRMSVSDVARFLQENLGQKLTAFIAGAQDVKQVGRWARGEHKPRLEAEERLRAAHQLFRLVQEAEGPHTARAWMIGMNPQLNDVSPAEALHKGLLREAMLAARSYIAGG